MNNDNNKKRKSNPRQSASLFSKATFWYNYEILKKGFKTELKEKNLYEILPEYDTCTLGNRIEREWNKQKCHKNMGMFLVFWNMFGISYSVLSITTLGFVAINVIRPTIIGKLVSYFTPGQTSLTKTDAYFLSLLLIGLQLIEIIWRHNYYFAIESLAIKVRTAVCSLIYRKFLKLTATRSRQISFGKITSLITKDINIFDQFFLNFSQTCSGFIVAVIIFYNFYRKIGLPAVVAVGIFALFIPIQVTAAIWIKSLKTATSQKTDIRIDLLQEVLSNIRSTKQYAWEKFAERKISAARRKELSILFKIFILLFMTVVIALIIHNVTFYFVMMTYVWLDQSLTAETMYFIIGALVTVSQNLVAPLPYGIFYGSQVIAAIKRAQDLVQMLETETENIPIDESKAEEPGIIFKNVTVQISNTTVFKNIFFDIAPGLTIIRGNASSGKSVLLMTIMNEFKVEGTLNRKGTISYASQEPWLFPSTIRQNIIFGDQYNEDRYQSVIHACALQYDFNLIENGDLTIVTDGGINLSKGQQIRINLARTVYKDRDIYLLDDCLSSLDALVARHIFINCILKFLKEKVVLLVTNDSNLFPYADNVLDLKTNSIKITRNKTTRKVDLHEDSNCCKILHKETEDDEDYTKPNTNLISEKKPSKIYKESNRTGVVSKETYKLFINFGGGIFYFLIIFGFFFFTQFSISYKDKLISKWANLEDEISQMNLSVNQSNHDTFTEKRSSIIYQYSILVGIVCILTLFRASSLFFFTKKVSLSLHKKMLKSILYAPLSFFDTTFIGNIVNRFSKDLVTIDESIPFPLLHLTAIVFGTVGNLLLISSTNVRFLIPTILLFIGFGMLRHVYLKTGRVLKRLDASTKSPVLGYLKATVDGLVSIKVFQAEPILKEEFEMHHNLYNSASYSYLSCLKAFVFGADFLILIFMAVVILQFVIFDEEVAPGDAGLAISQAFVIGGVFFFAINKGAEFETQMTSVERAIEYTKIPHESDTGVVLDNFPKTGKIQFQNVFLSVKNSNLLKNISFLIQPKETIGVVGRTGAGKSSIISALFRLYETEGKITIDDVDIKTLSLHFLRSKISIIPQDVLLYDSTLRENIDPENVYPDEVIWDALKTVKLNHCASTLDININELNFTCGQKQLFCLARVLIKNNKILVLDEMVENVDNESEDLIYKIIEEHFSECTVIKIAHKLSFLSGCDKILVIDNGEVIGFERPDVLLRNQNDLFYKMVDSSGFNFT